MYDFKITPFKITKEDLEYIYIYIYIYNSHAIYTNMDWVMT